MSVVIGMLWSSITRKLKFRTKKIFQPNMCCNGFEIIYMNGMFSYRNNDKKMKTMTAADNEMISLGSRVMPLILRKMVNCKLT